jgi:DNA repair protein RecO (recombination protein O)
VAPFHQGRLWLYHDPVRDSRKVTDFDVEDWRPGIRERYERAMAADAAAETILVSQGGGGAWDHAFNLCSRTLSALEGAGETQCLRVFLRFLWDWVDILGLRPELRCASCGRDFTGDGTPDAGERVWYSPREGGFFCAACGAGAEECFPLGSGARRWLAGAKNSDGPFPETSGAEGPPPEEAVLKELRAVLTGMMAHALGRRLGTWDTF